MNNNNSNSNKNSHHHQHHPNQYGNEFSLFVGDLPNDCSDDELQRLFQSKFKSVRRVQIIRHEDGKSRGFGFIRFEDRNDFEVALALEMRIGNKLLRLDKAHGSYKNRSRYPSLNSTGSNSSHQQNHHSYNNSNNSSNSNNNNNNNNSSNSSNNGSGSGLHHHHHHHHNQSHHHQQHHHNQGHQQHLNSAQQQPQQGQTNKTLTQDQLIGNQQSHHSGQSDGPSRVSNSLHHTGMNATNSATSTVHHHPHAPHHQQHNSSHNAHLNHNLFNPSQHKNSQRQQTAGNRSPKQPSQPSLTSGDDDAVTQSQPKQSLASPSSRPNILPQHQQQAPLQPVVPAVNSSIGLAPASSANITTTSSSAATSLSSSDAGSQSSSALVTNPPNINTTGHTPLGHDFRGYPQTGMLDNPHLMGATDPASVVPPSSVYGHLYPYAHPPHFGYLPQPQPNPVIPISAGPPLPPNQGSSSTAVGPQHSLPTANATRYGNAPHHPQAHLAGVPDASAMSTMTAGVQAPHQAPFYYYYTNPFYFDQSAAGAPPNMYHPQTLHPQFFALPNPAFMPNAHAYTNQQQTQPPTAPLSEATTTLVNQSQPPQPPQSHQQQVNIRTRDIDAPIE